MWGNTKTVGHYFTFTDCLFGTLRKLIVRIESDRVRLFKVVRSPVEGLVSLRFLQSLSKILRKE